MGRDDKLREAGVHFLVGSAIFDELKLESTGLKKEEITLDFSEHNLEMCNYLMKAQAQYCAFEKVKRSEFNKYSLLSQLAMQASVYYRKAYEFITSPEMSKANNLKNFISILKFNEHTFLAQANYWMSQQCVADVSTKKSGVGLAISYMIKAYESLNMIKDIEQNLSPVLRKQYAGLLKHYSDKRAYLEGTNDFRIKPQLCYL